MRSRIVITGANSAIGQIAVERGLRRRDLSIVAAVRSPRAASQLSERVQREAEVAIVDYADDAALARVCRGATAVLHLPGILIESRETDYQEANVETVRIALEASRLAGVAKFVLISACGAQATSSNRYLRTKGEAEQLVMGSDLPYTILRCPLVLACRSLGDFALTRRIRHRWVAVLGGGAHLEQPLDARDLAEGALNACDPGCASGQVLELVGPECLSGRALLQRLAGAAGRQIGQVPLPVSLARWVAGLRCRLRGPGISPDVIDVLTSDVSYDASSAASALGIDLTPLDETLRTSLAQEPHA